MSSEESTSADDNSGTLPRNEHATAGTIGASGAPMSDQHEIPGRMSETPVQGPPVPSYVAVQSLGPTDPEYVAGWWDETMSARLWWRRRHVDASDAALVLCGINSLSDEYRGSHRAEEAAETSLNELPIRDAVTGKHIGWMTAPRAHRELRQVFDDAQRTDPGSGRTMAEWLQLAKQEGLAYHRWVDEWLEAAAQLGSAASNSKSHATDHGHASSRPDAKQTVRLEIGRNGRESIAAYVGERSRQLYSADRSLTKEGIATTIATELKAWGYRGERGEYLAAATIVRLLPPRPDRWTGKERQQVTGKMNRRADSTPAPIHYAHSITRPNPRQQRLLR